VRSDRKFTEKAIRILADAIQEAEGNEVFAVGRLDGASLVDEIEIVARGHKSAVLALGNAYDDWDVLVHNHPSGALAPSEADLAVAAKAAEGGSGSYIVNNEVSRVYVVVEPTAVKRRSPLSEEDLAVMLEEGGSLSRRIASYEPRPAQIGLLKMVIRAFNEDAVLAAEAGTGVGKSFAYLLPAVAWAVENDERVVVSTATINLQQQLYEKDIPLVSATWGKPVKAVLMKGRGNYLCVRRLEETLRENLLFPEDEEPLKALASWAEETATGSRAELTFQVEEALWSRVCSEADTCLGLRCPRRDSCFVLRLRREASEARLIIVNHHLLFADLAARSSGAGYDSTVVLPPYERIIIDEAHNIEDAATSFFSEDFSRLSALKQIGRLYRRRGGLEAGLALRLRALTSGLEANDAIPDIVPLVREALESLDAAGVVLSDSSGTFRLTGPRDEALRSFLFEPLAELRRRISLLTGAVRELVEKVGSENAEDPAVWESKAIARRLESIGGVCGRFLEYDERPDEVLWIERFRTAKGESVARFIATPMDVAPSLRESLYAPNRTVACVSGTLTVADSFDYWLARAGAAASEDRQLLTGRFPSPFPYRSAVLLAAPVDAPLPEESGYKEFVDAAVPRLVAAAGGAGLILFTSYEAMRSSYAAAKPILDAAGIRALRQGDDDRARLLKTFLEDRSSVLFATDSFWEGVDAPGDTLRLVVLCRLPFRSPNEPVFEARREALEARGGNAFMSLSLPESVMKFKQGFGRLMRRGSDDGAVVVLDSRLLKKRYGEIFLRSLPETRTSFKPFSEIVEDVDRFLSR